MEELRSHPSYIALPAVPPLLQPSTYRCVATCRPRSALCVEQLEYGPTVSVQPIALVNRTLFYPPKPAMLASAACKCFLNCIAQHSAVLTSSTSLDLYVPDSHVPKPAQPCRYVRQESPLWSALHNGVLTSSTLNGALGFYEPGAVQQLGLPKHYARHGALMAAYSNLLEPEFTLPMQV